MPVSMLRRIILKCAAPAFSIVASADVPASEYGGRGSLNTTAPVFDLLIDATDARAQRSDDNGFNPSGPVAFSNRRKKE